MYTPHADFEAMKAITQRSWLIQLRTVCPLKKAETVAAAIDCAEPA